ncbi:MAG: alanine:cation symporter family protein [Anaplasmataceae bacterium]|nr:alanine:cation symporter family protein [Anaplasmataceae bacterium]
MNDIVYALKIFEKFLYKIVFFRVFDVPFLILWALCGYCFCFIRSKAINIRYFINAFSILLGFNLIKSEDVCSKKAVSHYQAFATAIAGSIGLGAIVGSVFAIKMGGPGSLLWIVIFGILSMSTKFFEVTLGFRFRTEDKLGYLGGPFAYIKYAFERIGFIKFGKFSAQFYAVIMTFNVILGILLFQSNQVISATKQINNFFINKEFIISGFYAVLIGIIIFGGLKRISNFVSGLVPVMMLIYLSIVFFTIFYYKENILSSLSLIVNDAFTNSKSGIFGGIIGVVIVAFNRALYTCEAGIGTSSIAHSGTNEKYPAKVGLVAMIEPIFDTCIMCFLSGFVIIVSKAYIIYPDVTGIELAVLAFESSAHYNLFLISTCSILFGLSTIISYSYYLEIAITYLLGRNIKNTYVIRIISIVIIFLSACFADPSVLIGICDIFFILLTIPNFMAIYLLNDIVILELKKYINNAL